MKTVLVVDDSATLRRMVIASLQPIAGLTCHEAANGLEAIERLSIEPVQLIILDLNMPDMHGMEVVEFVRKHSAFKKIPIIVLTTRSDEEIRLAALAAGATTFMTKPFKPTTLADNARELLDIHGS